MTRLARLIEQRGTSIRRLAADSGVPERTVYRHVSGETKMNMQQAAAYARALDVDLSELVDEAA